MEWVSKLFNFNSRADDQTESKPTWERELETSPKTIGANSGQNTLFGPDHDLYSCLLYTSDAADD